MAKRDIVVVGASAGGVTALLEFAKSLPADFPGFVFVVLHVPAYSPSNLPMILSRECAVRAMHPKDGEEAKPGVIYVAPPDHHMLLQGKKVLVKKGPKENRFRPSVDALFRSAAYVYGPRVVGIILSGLLNDGTSGLWSIKRLGGLSIIQSLADADYPSMPENAMEYVKADHIIEAKEMGPLLNRIMAKGIAKKRRVNKKQIDLLKLEVIIATRDNAFELGIMNLGEYTGFTCPECNGVLVRLKEGKLVRFRCHTGHAFTASALLAELSLSVEEKLWEAMKSLEETTMLLKDIGNHFKDNGFASAGRIFFSKSKVMGDRARVIHDSVFTQELLSEDIRHGQKSGSKKPGKK
jgi:two-component system, chemotaxis family, protein-glutamate methylesterase/glutaminase